MAPATWSRPHETAPVVPHELTLDLYQKTLRVYYVEERLKIFARQGKCTFHASTRGHEKLQIAMTLLLRPRHDWFFTYYREKAIAIGLGLPLRDIFLAMLSRAGDPNSNGRNMPEQFSSRELHLVSQTACTGTQFLPAVGMARALKRDGSDAVVYVSSGEGATSEGEFFEALNWAARERLPVLFVIQNNGYAISVPQASQTSSEIHRIARGFGMPTFDLDGTWFEPMYETLPAVIEQIRRGGGPALVEGRVVRIAVGGYIKGGPWHSACVEAAFAHIPGWRVVFPSCAEDAKGLIKTAARSEDPVIFLEHKGLYRRLQAKTPERDGDYLIPFGRGRVRREGRDVTVVTWGSTVYLALEAAKRLEAKGLSVEVIDLRSMVPLDEESIFGSLRKTSRLVVAHEDTLTMGFGAEAAARAAENFFAYLDAPIVRVAAKDSFVPAAPNLELAILPSVEQVQAAIEQVVAY